jgi:prepilin-type N-terminal cleavage/methylation domain-containing protein
VKPENRGNAATREGGFSAVELMLAMSLFGILMMGFLAVFPLGMRSVEKGERMTVASSLAQDEIERLKSLPRTDADITAGNHADAANPLLGVYTRSWVVTDDTPLAGMKRIDMTVSFSDNGIARNTQISTYITP